MPKKDKITGSGRCKICNRRMDDQGPRKEEVGVNILGFNLNSATTTASSSNATSSNNINDIK